MADDRITFDIKGTIFDQKKMSPAYRKGLEKGLEDVGSEVVQSTQDKLQAGKRVFFTGQLRASIGWRSTTYGVVIASGAAIGDKALTYAQFAEHGRGAGKMPPREAIKPWALKHGFTESTIFLLQRAIGRRGTRGIFMFRDTAKEWNGRKKRKRLEQLITHSLAKALNK